MGQEIEAKMRVPDHDAVRRRLNDAGARRVGAVIELNTFFDTPHRTLLAADTGLRLRRTRDVATGAQRHVITYKGPQQDSGMKRREEIELCTDDGDEASLLLQRLGFAPTLSFEKRRETWRLDACEIALDELPQLGCFVEIEGPDEHAILNVRAALQMNEHPIVQESYSALVDEALPSTGPRTLRFSG